MKAIDLDNSTVAIIAVVAVGGFLLWQVGGKVGAAITTTADMAGGVLTGNNAITGGARTDAYQGAGVVGTLGAAADRMSGGTLSTLGEKLGGWFFDVTH